MRLKLIIALFVICRICSSQTGLNDLAFHTIHCYDKNGLKYLYITGKMFDAATKEPLPNGTVWIKGTKIGNTTDANGSYTLTIADTLEKTVLLGSYINYEIKEIVISSSDKKDKTTDFALVSKPGISCPGVEVIKQEK